MVGWFVPGKKKPRPFFRMDGAYTWRRPTLTGPIVPLPSALQRFTSGFGMGPGGSTALWSPEGNAGSPLAWLPSGPGLGLWGPEVVDGRESIVDSQEEDFSSLSTINYKLSTCFDSARSLTSTRRVHFSISCRPRLLQAIHGSLFFLIPKNRNQAERMISTGKLHTLLHFHFQPINVVVFDDPSGKTHLGRSLALRCFQRLSLPHLATRPCS